jgi:membrane protein implicated in regulation of membrane protease activity
MKISSQLAYMLGYSSAEIRQIIDGKNRCTDLRQKRIYYMPYALIVTVAAIGLTGVYVCLTEAPFWSKGLMMALLLVSFAWSYGFYLQVGLGVFLAFYFTYLKSRWQDDGISTQRREEDKEGTQDY